MKTYGHVNQKCKATISVYVQNFQTVTSKLLENKLETTEVLLDNDGKDVTEQAKTSILQLESRTSEHTLTNDTLMKSSDAKKAPKDVATLKLQEYEPCAPLSSFPEESCGDVEKFSANKVS